VGLSRNFHRRLYYLAGLWSAKFNGIGHLKRSYEFSKSESWKGFKSLFVRLGFILTVNCYVLPQLAYYYTEGPPMSMYE